MLDSQESGEGRTLACDSLKLVCENFVFEKGDRQTETQRERARERERECIYICVCVCACRLSFKEF